MKRYRLRNTDWRFTNIKTGEVADVDITIHRGQGGKFMKVFQDTTMELLRRNPQIRGQTLRLLLLLISKADWANVVPSTALVAGEQKISQSNVSRAYAELVKADFLIKRDHSYYLNPLFCWKGNDQQYEEAMRGLVKPKVRVISSAEAERLVREHSSE